jgi:hypothetical protein
MSRRNSLLRRYGEDGGRYTEEVLEAAARETCRFSRMEHCLTFFARWAYDHPQSPRLRAVLAEARRALESRQASLAPNRIEDVQAFFEGKFDTGTLPLAEAQALTDRFTAHYSHAVPFDVNVLDAIWDRCRDLRCGTARRKVEQKLGMLEDGSRALPARERGGARGYPTPPPESSPATPGLSPEPELD